MFKSENNSTIRLKRLEFLFNLETLFIRGETVISSEDARVGGISPCPECQK